MVRLLASRPLTSFDYWLLSRFNKKGLDVPGGKIKGVIMSFDVETWSNKCGGQVEASADPEDEYFGYLPKLLDIFDSYRIKVQFFVCGRALKLYPKAFELVAQRGHGIGGHGYNHEVMSSLPIDKQKMVVGRVKFLLRENFSIRLKSWRCPGLMANLETYRALRKLDVGFASNARRGMPMIIDGVVEVPMASKMDGAMLGYHRQKSVNASRWAGYMEKKFDETRGGILVFGMHTWVQRKYDPQCDAVTRFLNYLEPHRSEVWLGSFDDL